MGAIDEIYADIDADVSKEEFREAVDQKVKQMEGLADEETAAMILAHELADGEVETISDIEPGMDEVKFLAKITAIGDLRTFERDDDDTEGRVLNVDVADETDSVVLTFWDTHAEGAADELDVGDVLRVKGRPRDGYRGLEVSVDKAEIDDDVELDVTTGTGSTVDSLSLGQGDITLSGVVLDTGTVRTFNRDDGSEGRVSNLTLGDETGRIRVTLWDDRADRATELDAGTTVELTDGYVRERDGSLELHVGESGRIDEIESDVTYEPDSNPISAVEIGDVVDIAGVVRSVDPKRTFDRDDGSEGQVRNIRLQDETGDIRVALWGEKADIAAAPGDKVLVADAEIQDGWQDDLEASAGWRATVAVLSDAATGSQATGTTASASESETGTSASQADSKAPDSKTSLDSFADGTGSANATDESINRSESEENSETETVEFTGTVVQTGEPVVLDNGTETMSVETTASVRLGETVTARGTLVDDRLDADELL